MDFEKLNEQNFDVIINVLRKSILDSNNHENIINSHIIEEIFEFVKKYTTIEFIEPCCYVDTFLSLVYKMYRLNSEDLILKIKELNIFEWTLQRFTDQCLAVTDEYYPGYANRRSIFSTFYYLAEYDEHYVDVLFEKGFVNMIMNRVKINNKKYGAFRSLMQDISQLTSEINIFKKLASTFIHFGLVKELRRIYTTIDPEEISTKFYIARTLNNLVKHNLIDHELISLMIHILEMKESKYVIDSDDVINYCDYICSICKSLREILISNGSNTKSMIMNELKNNRCVYDNLKNIVDNTIDCIQKEYITDDPKNLLQLIL